MTRALLIAAWIALTGGLVVAIGAIIAWWAERRALLTVLRGVAPSGQFRERAELVALKRRLSAEIHWDPKRMHERRALLRASAHQVLATGEGFCGENARVAVRLLNLGGIPAHRLYLEGPRWGHVVVEHRWEGRWRLFDAHVDPRTALPDEAVGRIDAGELATFPNRAAENPWKSSYRIPGVRRLPVSWAGRLRPPAALTALAETPALLGLSAGILLVLLAAVALLGG